MYNDRRYGDYDLTIGSIDPHQIFPIFHEIHAYAAERGKARKIGYMIDQSHNDKPKIEATIQAVMMAQELFAKAALVDHGKLAALQGRERQVDAEEMLRRTFFTDGTPILQRWRKANGLPADPLAEHRKNGYEKAVGVERKARRKALGLGAGGGYA